jgi:CBS domain-containing membrane protein
LKEQHPPAPRYFSLHTLRSLWPDPVRVDPRERVRACAGALAGILVAGLLGMLAAGVDGGLWLIAPLGASAVLAFVIPASPMAQPWPVVGGNVLSSLVGVACAGLPLPLPVAAALAAALAIALMFATRSLHPPGGAAALLAVLSSQVEWSYLLFPVAFNSIVLVLCAAAFNSLTGRRYPHSRQVEPAITGDRFSTADIDSALAHYNQYLDVSRHDLAELLHHVESAAYQRQLGNLRCADIMTMPVVSADYGMPLGDAWHLMRERHIKALPVIDDARRIIGIVTAGDFLKLANLDRASGIGERLRSLLQASGALQSDRPEVIGHVMTRRVQVISGDRPVLELLPILAGAGHHHIPIIDRERRLVGIVTQTDLVRALYRSVAAPVA